MAPEPVPFTLDPFGSFEFNTSGTGPVESGVIEVRTEGASVPRISGTEIFDVLGSPVSVPNSPARTSHQVYVSRDDAENTGMAFFNPHPEVWQRVILFLVAPDGQIVDITTVELAPRQQIIGFVDEDPFFGGVLEADFPDGFKGTVEAYSETDLLFSMLGLIQRADGSLVAVETVGL